MLGLRSVRRSLRPQFSQKVSFSTNPAVTFNVNRANYREELNRLRKVWNEEHAAREKRIHDALHEQKRQVILERAIRLRKKRESSVQTVGHKVSERYLQRKRRRALLARACVASRAASTSQRKIYRKLQRDYEEEKDMWLLTKRDLNSMLSPSFFVKPSTTGLITPHSKHWQHQVITFDERRVLTPELKRLLYPATKREKIDESKFFNGLEKEALEQFLEGFVSTGKDRLMLKDAVNDVVKSTGGIKIDGFQEVLQLEAAVANRYRIFKPYRVSKIPMESKNPKIPTVLEPEIFEEFNMTSPPVRVERSFKMSEADREAFLRSRSEVSTEQPNIPKKPLRRFRRY